MFVARPRFFPVVAAFQKCYEKMENAELSFPAQYSKGYLDSSARPNTELYAFGYRRSVFLISAEAYVSLSSPDLTCEYKCLDSIPYQSLLFA